MNHVSKQQHGFTLIELMLAMGFVSVLLVAIAMTVIQIADIYNRGITLKDVNQAGRSLASELQRSIDSSAEFNLDGAHYVPTTATLQAPFATAWGGRLCMGQYSYVWNNGSAINDSRRNKYINAPVSSPEIRFVKVYDPKATLCVPNGSSIYPPVKYSDASELLNADVANKHDLAVHSFKINSTPLGANDTAFDAKTKQRMYSIKFIIGTNDQTTLTFDSGGVVNGCRPPSDPKSDPSYCSINEFNIVARAGNAVE